MIVVRLMTVWDGYRLRGQEKHVFFWVVVTQHVYAETHCTTYLGFVHFTVCKVYLSNKVTEITEASNFKILVVKNNLNALKAILFCLICRFFWISMIMKSLWALHWQKRVSTEEISHILDPQLLDPLLPMGCSGKRMC